MTGGIATGIEVAATLRGRRVLVVEDRSLIARKLLQLLDRAGCKVAGPVATLDEGLALAEQERGTLHAALLDIDLQGEEAYPLAEALRAWNVPLLFLTGYGSFAIPPRWRLAPHVEKPFEAAALLRTLAAVVAGATEPPPEPPGRLVDARQPLLRSAWEAICRSRNLALESRILGQLASRV